MDQNTDIGRISLGGDNSDSITKGLKEQWDMPEFQDTVGSKKREAKILTFYRNEEEGERYFAPCYVGGLHAYDGEINLGYEKNVISNEFAVKLCLKYEEKNGEKLVKRELLVSLKGEFYFIKFKINEEEDDTEPNVILGNNEENCELMFDLDDLDEIEETKLPPLICKMGKSSRNKKRALEDFQICYLNEGPSRSRGEPMRKEEATREKLAISICERYAILEENRPVIKTLAYSVMYRKLLDEICLDKKKLDEAIKDEQKEAIEKVKGEALIEKEDPSAFILPIRLEGKINLNGLADIGFEVNVMPYRIYMDLRREKVKKVNRGIEMINHSFAELIGLLKGVLCQVGVTTIIAKFFILDIPIDRDAQIVVGRGFLSTCGGVLDTIDRVMSTYNGVYHQTFGATKTRVNTTKSDNDDEDEYSVKRDEFGSPIYGPKSPKYLNITEPIEKSLALQAELNPFRKICVWKKAVSFLESLSVPLQHVDWKPEYTGFHQNEEEEHWYRLKSYECAGDLLILELVLDNHYETVVRSRSYAKSAKDEEGPLHVLWLMNTPNMQRYRALIACTSNAQSASTSPPKGYIRIAMTGCVLGLRDPNYPTASSPSAPRKRKFNP
ncbi:hypothetical protein Tco_1494099 [Tanacetum coccineum]